MQEIQHLFQSLLGLGVEPQVFTAGQIAARAVLIYLIGWLMLRVGEHRFLGKNTAFDIVLGFIFGSLLSRAINGNAPFVNTIAAGFILLTLHWLFVTLAVRSDWMDRIVNGDAVRLIENGRIDAARMRRARISDRILRENLRINGGVCDASQVAEADFEPSGAISVIPRRPEARIVEVDVHEGVQSVRIRID